MKYFLLIISILVCQCCYAQTKDTTDIFQVDKNYELVLRPEIRKRIDKKIAPIVLKKIEQYKLLNTDNGRDLSHEQKKVAFEFIRDTLYLNEFLSEYTESYSSALTTMGMNWGESQRLQSYDRQLNKYYQKALSVLQPAMKNKLIASQKIWLDYYLNDKEFIYELNYFGNHNSSLYNWGYYFEMLEKRVLFLKEIYEGDFHGTETYRE